jgi:hypothetical protein
MNYLPNTLVKKIITIILLLLLSSTLLIAQTKDTTTAATTAPPANPLSITGLVDVNYNYNFNNPLSRMNGYRNFDVQENSFNINEARLTFQKNAAPVGFRVDLAYGQTMDLVNSDANLGSPNPGAELSLKNVEQAYLTAVIPIGSGLTVNAGKMSTHMGSEVIETLGNINYSRSFLFTFAIPYFHNGICAEYTFSPQFSSTLYVYNGWNDVITVNSGKTIGAEIMWTPDSIFNFTENFIGGAEEANSYAKRYVFDSIFNLQATDALFVTLDADYGQESDTPVGLAIWKGAALTGKYTLTDVSAIAARGEYYYDQNGWTTGTLQALKEITLTYEYKFGGSLVTRLEYRRDWSDESTFEDNAGNLTKNNQNTILIGSVYSF